MSAPWALMQEAEHAGVALVRFEARLDIMEASASALKQAGIPAPAVHLEAMRRKVDGLRRDLHSLQLSVHQHQREQQRKTIVRRRRLN